MHDIIIKSNSKHLSCKISQEGHCEQRCEIQGSSQEMTDCRLMAKNLITTNLVSNPSELATQIHLN